MIGSILLVRESAEQLTGSGCCGKLEGTAAFQKRNNLFPNTFNNKCVFGELYILLRDRYAQDDIEVTMVDPRNVWYLIPGLIKDILLYRPAWNDAVRTLFCAFRVPAVICNGRVLISGDIPSIQQLAEQIHSLYKAH